MGSFGEQGGQLVLIRHAPTTEPSRLCGRTDVDAVINAEVIARIAADLPPVDRIITSPAKRCRATTAALWPKATVETDDRLWEQDFGIQEAMPYSDLPDLGVLSSAELADYTAEGGESFADVCRRVEKPLAEHARTAAHTKETIALVVHAGVIRAALALVSGSIPSGLVFEIAHLSVTRLRAGPDGPISIIEVNRSCRAKP